MALAAQYRVSPFAIASVNGLMPAAPLIPGQSLFIPDAGNTPTGLPWPLVFLTMSPSLAEQGRTLRLKARLDGEAVLSGAFDLHPLRFAEEGGAWYALQGIEAEAEPGLHSFTITVTLPSGQSTSFAQLIPVRRMDYGTQNLPPVDPLTIDPTVTEPEWEYLKSFTTQFTPARYWQGVFALPFGGRVSSPFGIVRTYNNGQFVSSHTGTDFTGRPGSPIYAAAAGVVVVAEPLTVRGNATLIDHGWGVYTGYWHQSEIKVEVGDVVRAGQEIGLLGSTGRVTGPNLHWELWVGGAPIDPMEWTETPFP
ncbi:MAG: M23 family metallopeptidase [Chloroflexi bacterium]|nr:M23 family metallopeptidase [Chloroflexota bacterium]